MVNVKNISKSCCHKYIYRYINNMYMLYIYIYIYIYIYTIYVINIKGYI